MRRALFPFAMLAVLVNVTACTWSRGAVVTRAPRRLPPPREYAGSLSHPREYAGPPTDASHVGLYVAVPPNAAGGVVDTLGFVTAVGSDAAASTQRLREDAARLGADAIVEVELRIAHDTVTSSGRAIHWAVAR